MNVYAYISCSFGSTALTITTGVDFPAVKSGVVEGCAYRADDKTSRDTKKNAHYFVAQPSLYNSRIVDGQTKSDGQNGAHERGDEHASNHCGGAILQKSCAGYDGCRCHQAHIIDCNVKERRQKVARTVGDAIQ